MVSLSVCSPGPYGYFHLITVQGNDFNSSAMQQQI